MPQLDLKMPTDDDLVAAAVPITVNIPATEPLLSMQLNATPPQASMVVRLAIEQLVKAGFIKVAKEIIISPIDLPKEAKP